MAKTDVLLIKNVVNLGGESDQVKVAAGYARNYLLPLGLAVPLGRGNQRRIEVLRQRRAEREAQEYNTMSELGKSLAKMTITISVKTGDDGKMFGSVTSGSIADALKTSLDVALDKRKIHLDHPIHTVGEHEVELRLHPEVKVPLKVVVKSSNPPPDAPAGTAPGAPGAPGAAPVQKSEKRASRNALMQKPEAAAAPKGEKPGKGEKAQHPEKTEKVEKADKQERSDKQPKGPKAPKA